MLESLAPAITIERHHTGGLPEAHCVPIVERIREHYLWFSPGSSTADMIGRLRQHPRAITDLLVNEEDGDCLGFSVYFEEEFEGRRVMFRGGTVVRLRSCGHYRYLLSTSIPHADVDFVATMTQNPRVYETVRSFSPQGIAYPNPERVPDDLIRRVAQRFCRAPGLDPDTFIVRNVYEDIRKDPEFKVGRDPVVADMFSTCLGQDDAFFVVVPMK